MEENKDIFHYTYSAAQQEEIGHIRKKYLAPAEPEKDKMTLLRELDAGVSRKAAVWGIVLGTAGALIMGAGMSLVMTDIGALLGMNDGMLPGIVTGLVGMLGVILAYPVYHKVLARERKKAAPQILALTRELLEQ